jgi:hypothetical protein
LANGVTGPLTTRDVVGLVLSACANAPLGTPARPVYRMSRAGRMAGVRAGYCPAP